MGFISSSLRPGHPDFLDLPWHLPLEHWAGHCDRWEDLPRGVHRHSVVFVNYDGRLYALKELPLGRAEAEYELLRGMQELSLPVVEPVGHLLARSSSGESGVLVTRYLARSLPYHLLFMQSGLRRYRDGLLDAVAILLVQLHVAGVFWGDCSLSNTLFRRDAGALQAYLVDAETSEIRQPLSDGLRGYDLDVMEENVGGGLLDLVAMGALADDYPAAATGAYIRQRYLRLWEEITREVTLAPGERYRIQERIRSLNAMGFSVEEVELRATDGGQALRLKVQVTDRHFHRNLLHSLTGLETEEGQARQLLNDVQEFKAALSEQQRRSVPLSAAAHHWLSTVYTPTLRELSDAGGPEADAAELYCQVLEHKWYLSEQAQRDVGLPLTLEDFVERFRSEAADDEGAARDDASGALPPAADP